MADVPSQVLYGQVVGHFVQFIADTDDPDMVPDEVPLAGTVTLTPLVTTIRFPTTSPPRLAVAQTVVCRVVDGDLYPPGEEAPGVWLIASNQPAGYPNKIQWTGTFKFTGVAAQPAPVTFEVPSNGTIDLAVIAPVPAEPPTVTVVSHADAIAAQQAAQTATDAAAQAVTAANSPGRRGSLWWVSNPAYWDVVNVPGPLPNDQFLYPTSGDVFSYLGPGTDWGDWHYDGSIAGPQGPPGLSDYPGARNVKLAPYNAKGDGSTDDTAAIQAAINDAHALNGGTIVFPAGTYKISAALTLYSFITLVGETTKTAIIKQTSTTADALVGQQLEGLRVQELTVQGPGSGTGRGMYLSRQLSPLKLNWRLNLRRVIVTGFGGDGIVVEQAIVSGLDTVQVDSCGGHGFNFYGVSGGAPGTSVNFTACYANGCGKVGYNLDTMTYCSFDACATDHCGVGYLLTGCSGIALSGSGCESTEIKNGYAGDGIQINNCTGVMVSSGFLYQMAHHGIWVRGASTGVVLAGVREWYDTAGSSGNSYIFTDGASGTVLSLANRMPVSYGGGVVSQITTELPTAGTTNQVLAKKSNTTGDVQWVTPSSGLPSGGTTGQVLAKKSGTDGDVQWITPAAGGVTGFVWMGT